MPVEAYLSGCRRAVSSLAGAVDEIDGTIPSEMIANAVDRGLFRPQEEAELLAWFARFLTIRSGLWEVISDVSAPVDGRVEGIFDTEEWRCFVLGYTAACLVVRLDRTLLETVAPASVTQRKLNEGSALHRIPRKQYTEIFESFTDPGKARQMEKAMRLARSHRRMLGAMSNDPVVGEFVARLDEREAVLEPSRRRYFKLLMNYLLHTFRRRGASARQQTVFATLETGGRLASELRDQWSPCRIDDDLRNRIDALLQPGDVLISRHERALTNLFLPGFWPHAALYIGSEDDRRRMSITIDEDRAARWSGERRVIEALKDGVLFRPLEETLAVDAVAVIRPQLDQDDLARGIARVTAHEGKLYNFDFDFFRSDRLVCTEVIYRAFDGLGPIEIPLQDRSGRPTLSAEDLLDLAYAGDGFEPVAVFGGPSCPDRLVEGDQAREAISPANRQPPSFIADHVAE
jgi:Permuted papain-like amidase enzyme, YaeF/YiiX, C92 family